MSLQESIRRVRFLLRSAIGRRRLERDMDAELAHHIEMETAANIRAGLPPEEAARRARIAFGGGQRFREEARDELRTRAVEDAAQDLKFASRSFRRTPAFTATVVLTLAVGIGATTVVFSVADNVVLRALPYANADRLATVEILTDRLKNITPTWTPNAAHYLA